MAALRHRPPAAGTAVSRAVTGVRTPGASGAGDVGKCSPPAVPRGPAAAGKSPRGGLVRAGDRGRRGPAGDCSGRAAVTAEIYFSNNYRDLCEEQGTGRDSSSSSLQPLPDTWRSPFEAYAGGRMASWVGKGVNAAWGMLGRTAAVCRARPTGWPAPGTAVRGTRPSGARSPPHRATSTAARDAPTTSATAAGTRARASA